MNLYALFHLNLMYSSIEEHERPLVIERCYRPLLQLAERLQIPIGIEAPGISLELIAEIDPEWIAELRKLIEQQTVQFIGSGYSQIIGPLVPASLNRQNLRLGHEVYERLLGVRPRTALVNEQAYSGGLLKNYEDAGYNAIVMEWHNCAEYHPDWDPQWQFFPQYAVHSETRLPVVWTDPIAFQKMQRLAHGQIEEDTYMDYLSEIVARSPANTCFPLYSNDVEIFDYRPGRFATEQPIDRRGEWARIESVLALIKQDERFTFVALEGILNHLGHARGGKELQLGSAERPIPVKKQAKYNITRWALSGCDDVGINTACWRIWDAIRDQGDDADWRELCFLWSSDFRTHITERRWNAYRTRLDRATRRYEMKGHRASKDNAVTVTKELQAVAEAPVIKRNGSELSVSTSTLRATFDCRSGLAIRGLWLGQNDGPFLCGTLPHGYYSDISLVADWYSGHLVLEEPAKPKVTDLYPCEPSVTVDSEGAVCIEAAVSTALGPIHKRYRIPANATSLALDCRFDWDHVPLGRFHVGHVTINPEAFDVDTLYYAARNGGNRADQFFLKGRHVAHSRSVSSLVSASEGVGMTDGCFVFGDGQRAMVVDCDRSVAAAIGMVTYRETRNTYFCRLSFSLGEIDETSRTTTRSGMNRFSMRIDLASADLPREAGPS